MYFLPVYGVRSCCGDCLGRCYLKGRAGDAANVVLSAVGHNFRRILAWLRVLWRPFLAILVAAISDHSPLQSAS